ncbi:hypothetical protein JTF06_07215 [Desemzia sp. RIT804]|uniref:hypothetical protein n=1 Tax=Desemzia sp. RIT 804 TaxID=2810209 RepID=UPI00194E4261|nr:hypothetical protein [Desemzia sp. RIT 804]MBM6614677.1 hypothetical protein [Desemzia sp. RIT 804]
MSCYRFIASTNELPEIENPHVQLYSINEALANGIEIDTELMELGLDLDEPEMILWVENEELLEEITLIQEEDPDYSDPHTQLTFRYTLEAGRYTEERAEQLVTHIKEHLQTGGTLELWDTWMDDNGESIVTSLELNDLKPEHTAFLFSIEGAEQPTCLVVKN